MNTRKVLAVALSLSALSNPRPAAAIAQRAGDFELEIDAPWRMEPRGPNLAYGAIPIQVSIHDADQPATLMDRKLQQIITASQRGFTAIDLPIDVPTRYDKHQLWEKFKNEALLTIAITAIAELLEGLDTVIRKVLGFEVIPADVLPSTVTLNQFQSLVIFEEINDVFLPRQTFTLSNIHEVERTVGLWQHAANQQGPESPFTPPARPSHSLCRRWQGESCSGFAALRPTSEWNLTAMYTPAIATPGRNVRLRADLRVSAVDDGVATTKTYRRILNVHLGDEPLPKFDAGWAYGDLHYHSQGTDNDGESGYSYRGTLQAMGALGLDFGFATDHASNSPQIGSVEPKLSRELVRPLSRGLRDMSPDRFAFGIEVLNGPLGGNRQVTSYPRSAGSGSELVAPQLFLGAEVDVIPEAQLLSPIHFCKDLPKMLKYLDQGLFPDEYICESMGDPQPDGRMLAFDVQGPNAGRFLSTRFYARQHLLHLPVDGQRRDAFIPSNTSKYGGATRRLGEILDLELAQRQKGYAFLAHPLDQASGADVGRLGPDLIAYSPEQLEDAFESPYILGLQIWNENSLFSATATDLEPFASPSWELQHQPDHSREFQMWDIQQLFGLDKARTGALTWLEPGQPRRTFAAGGSDAHGDWNYRREGYFFGTGEAVSTAMGTPRNLVYVGEPQGSTIAGATGTGRPLSQAQVVDGLRSGNFAITDGPAVRIVVDVNKNGSIDPGDVPMGGVHSHPSNGPFQVIVEWKSSPEFGLVREINLLVGVWAGGFVDGGMVYTRSYEGPIANASNTYVQPGTNTAFVKTPNIPYWYDPDPANRLFIKPSSPSEAEHGQRVVTIDPSRYPVGRGVCADPILRASDGTGFSSPLGSMTTSTASIGSTPGGGTPTGGGNTVVYMDTSLAEVLEQLGNGTVVDPPPPCMHQEFQDAKRPERMFIRAQVRNDPAPGSNPDCSDAYNATPQCVYHQAFSNPVWVGCVGLLGCAKVNVEAQHGLVLTSGVSTAPPSQITVQPHGTVSVIPTPIQTPPRVTATPMRTTTLSPMR